MVGAEQLMDLGAQALDRRYSSCHGCRSSLVLGRSREPTPVAHLHQRPDATRVTLPTFSHSTSTGSPTLTIVASSGWWRNQATPGVPKTAGPIQDEQRWRSRWPF